MEKEELYKIAIDTRKLEVNLFWQRSNYFLALNTAIAIAFFTQKAEIYAPIIAMLGIIVSLLWFNVSTGAKFWQSRWEYRLMKLEKELGEDINLFSADWDVIYSDVQESIKYGKHSGIAKIIDKAILKKPSVSLMMIVLSIVFILTWSALFVAQIIVS